MNFPRKVAVTGAIALASLSFAAPSLVGTWTGHAHLMAVGKPTPQQQQQMTKTLAAISKMHISLTLKKDHTFTSSATGGPMPQTQSGKWSQAGNKVSLATAKHTQVFTLAANGKSMTFSIPTNPQVKGEVVFTK